MGINWYARALDVLAQDCNDCDSDKIVLEIAKRNPSVLVKAIEAICQRERGESHPDVDRAVEAARTLPDECLGALCGRVGR